MIVSCKEYGLPINQGGTAECNFVLGNTFVLPRTFLFYDLSVYFVKITADSFLLKAFQNNPVSNII